MRARRAFAKGANMRRAPITSSMMASAGYDEATGVLEIEFLTGAVYQYVDVPSHLYRSLLDAPSQGRFFHGSIRDAFRCQRVAAVSAQ